MQEASLVAALGDHPAVVTAMVEALHEYEDVSIDQVQLLHPTDTGKGIAACGVPLIQEHLEERCQVVPVGLPFADPNSTEACVSFMRRLGELMLQYSDPNKCHVYFSLAGGRKNMSALMGLVAQFFPAVRGLYHLIDVRQRKGHTFPSIESLLYMSREEQRRALSPPMEALRLVEIPYPGAFIRAGRLWAALRSGEPVDLSPQAEAFYRRVAGYQGRQDRLSVRVSEKAMQEYESLGPQMQNRVIGYTQRMRYPQHLEAKASGPRGWETDCTVYPEHKAHSNLRMFYAWDRETDTVTICRIMLHDEYDRKGTVWSDDHSVTVPVSRLRHEVVLVAPLGTSPMVVTQTYTLLRASQAEGEPDIPTVAVVYPQMSAQVRRAARLLASQFQRKDIDYQPFPIEGLRDTDSAEACETFIRALVDTLEALRDRYPDKEVALSLSGGRKAMSTLTLFAAQRAGIQRLYHTLISDIELERQILRETRLDALEGLPTDDARTDRLFLDAYPKEHFELFSVPVIPLCPGKGR